MLLRRLGLREHVINLRFSAQRARRQFFERMGSTRYSHPALHDMDGKLDRIIDRDRGFFVEAGGFDGYTASNTCYLERFRGWRGLLVEPMPELATQARRNRPAANVVQCALVGSDYGESSTTMEFGDLMTTVRAFTRAIGRRRGSCWGGVTTGLSGSRAGAHRPARRIRRSGCRSALARRRRL
jgi:hypothetical protein